MATIRNTSSSSRYEMTPATALYKSSKTLLESCIPYKQTPPESKNHLIFNFKKQKKL